MTALRISVLTVAVLAVALAIVGAAIGVASLVLRWVRPPQRLREPIGITITVLLVGAGAGLILAFTDYLIVQLAPP